MFTSAFLLANSANNISANSNSVLNALTLNTNILDSVSASVDTFSEQVFDSVFNWGLYLIEGILGFVLAGSLLMLLGVAATYCFGLYSCRNSVHLGWVAYGVTYFGVIAITFLFLSLGGISYQFCQFYGGLVTNNVSFIAFAQPTGDS